MWGCSLAMGPVVKYISEELVPVQKVRIDQYKKKYKGVNFIGNK